MVRLRGQKGLYKFMFPPVRMYEENILLEVEFEGLARVARIQAPSSETVLLSGIKTLKSVI